MSETALTYQSFTLPMSVVSHIDLSHLVRDVERIDNDRTAATVRAKAGASEQPSLPPSVPLRDFLDANQLTLESAQERSQLVKELRLLKDKAPVIHLTFASPADQDSLQQLARWARESVHPQAILAVGLQPALIAGVYVRTPNHVHDLSARARLSDSRSVLVKDLEALRGDK